MAAREPAEVVVEDPDGAVGDSPWFPGAHHDGAHGTNPSGVSVVICSRDRGAQLRRAIAAVRAVLRAEDELLVVDSASADASVASIAAEAGARVLRAAAPGLARARNVGWRRAGRDVVAFTDDDCEPMPGWTRHVEDAFRAQGLGFAFGQVLARGGGEPLSVTADARPQTFRGADAVVVGHGANLSCRVAALAAVGGFDDALGSGSDFPAGEDSDIARRMLRAGWDGAFVPTAVVVHEQWRGRRAALRVMYRYGVGAGAVAVKAYRTGDGLRPLRRELWDEGLAMAARHARNRYEFGVAACLCRTAGTVTGAGRAMPRRVEGGVFVG